MSSRLEDTPVVDEPVDPEEEAAERRQAFFRLMLIIAAGVVASAATGVGKTVAVMFAVIVMIILHELGHFATAKWSGMKVTQFFVGFGPRLWSVKRGETEYGVKAIPAGGYCRIVGMSNLEDVAPEDEPRTFREKGYWSRLSVAVAGSVMHFIIAFVLLWVLNGFVGVNTGSAFGSALHPNAQPLVQVGDITRFKNGPSPAQEAGLRVGDKIVAVDGRRFSQWKDLPPYIRARPGQSIAFTVRRGSQTLTLHATPVDGTKIKVDGQPALKGTEPTGFIGIGPAFAVIKTNPASAVVWAGRDLGHITVMTGKALGSLVTLHGVKSYGKELTGSGSAQSPDSPRLLSPVGLVKVAGNAASHGFGEVLVLLISINIFVGMFNMVPLLPLDGGYVAIATYEAIRSRIRGARYRVDMTKIMPVYVAVFLLIVFLGVTSLYLDIVRPLKLQ
jgi:membrane-associated protease RseP (regulator of RpoE activity)